MMTRNVEPIKSEPVACPHCGQTASVRYVELRRIEKRFCGASIETHEFEGFPPEKINCLVLDKDPDEEVVDSMGNEEYLYCAQCDKRWPLPDDIEEVDIRD